MASVVAVSAISSGTARRRRCRWRRDIGLRRCLLQRLLLPVTITSTSTTSTTSTSTAAAAGDRQVDCHLDRR